ncbi:MAG TPA: 2-dehydro-3-deoxy-6-phosphogalactonate aldolase [Gammaproteobacteria bacterium]|nr:2-dehydro-3-deoxy-6-phosphogalactonate aldolase [Gammaproteobacteria bacterium]
MPETPLQARFDAAFRALPLVAILRGIEPAECENVAVALHGAGFRLIEIPLNSPEPFESIERARRALPADALVGAGTVLRAHDVQALAAAGGELVVMPHADTTVIRAAKDAGLVCVPGATTPTEAFAALEAGADALKLFPAELISPAALKAMRAVLPKALRLLPVGGITPDKMRAYVTAGANGFGLGSALYVAGTSAARVTERARAFVDEWRALAAA